MTPRQIISAAAAAIAGVLALFVFFGSFYTIDQGERGVILRNGAIVGTAEPGLHFKTPWIETVHTISVQTRSITFENEPAYSADRQTADITFSINYTALPSEVATIYSRYGSLEGLEAREIVKDARDRIKTIFGHYTAATAISDRGKLGQEIFDAISKTGDGLIKVESIQVENIDFSDTVEQALEQRSKAEAEVQTKKQELEKAKIDAQIAVTNAQATADSALAAAKAAAEATRLAGDAEATAIRAKGKALSENPGLVSLIQAEKWDGKLPTTMPPNSSVPFLNVGKTP